ncbi:MAG TPA: GNAT family N-acetyltransferase [Solirubrobacteraceae bacterium]|jgi:GNAT superfamily N-acetyltransferase|nr:GNAT family N-acetyltransferase [Solirubrobacteraceae bacterium]
MELAAAAFEYELADDTAAAARWRSRLAHPSATDPEGAFVAELGDEIVGVAMAIARERLWCLSLLAVAPSAQSDGSGRALMERALTYASASTDIGLIPSSSDPRALRLYALSGFDLHPTFEASGILDRSALPRPTGSIRAGDEADLEALEPISRAVRGAAHTTEIQFALGLGARLLRLGDRGFAVVYGGHAVWLLAALDDDAAAQLLWAALALADTERPTVSWITAAQQWAIDVVVRAGLRLVPDGALCVRGDPGTLAPYLPSGPFA